MIKWWRERKKRICVEKAQEITSVRSRLEMAKRRLKDREAAFWSASPGLIIQVGGDYPGSPYEVKPIYVSDWPTIEAIRELVNAAEIAEVKRLEAKLDALTGGYYDNQTRLY
jgi:hypothetical protein